MDELALCYFTNNTDKEPKGWIYLKDVRELSDDGKIMTITTTSRNMVIKSRASIMVTGNGRLLSISNKCEWYRK